MQPHKFTFDKENDLLHISYLDKVTLENSYNLLAEVVNHTNFPDQVSILLDLSQAEIDLSMTDILLLEAFQRKYIDEFSEVSIAINAPQEGEKAVYSLFYDALIKNTNCNSKVFQDLDAAIKWLASFKLVNKA